VAQLHLELAKLLLVVFRIFAPGSSAFVFMAGKDSCSCKVGRM
jgi:hypothetical protein